MVDSAAGRGITRTPKHVSVGTIEKGFSLAQESSPHHQGSDDCRDCGSSLLKYFKTTLSAV